MSQKKLTIRLDKKTWTALKIMQINMEIDSIQQLVTDLLETYIKQSKKHSGK
jgi:hypothetical protein